MRRTWALVCVAAFCATWVACRPARGGWIEDRDGKTIIHVKLWLLPDPTRTETFWRGEVAGVREFRRRFPRIFAEKYRDKYKANPEKYGRHNWDDVEIELHQFSGIQVEGVEVDLLAIAGKVAADVLYVNFRKSDTYIQQGFLYPLDKPEDGYLEGMTKAEQDFRIHEKIWPVIRRIGPGGAEHVWAVPYGGALGKVLLYRKDLFDEAGIAYPDENWTWDDLFAACRKITNPKRGIYGILFGRGKHESWYWITFLWSAGGEVMTYNKETDEWRSAFGTREAAVALDFYTRLCTEKWTDKDGKPRRGYSAKDAAQGSQLYKKWDDGEIGMHLAYIDEKIFQQINPDVTGMAPVPLGPTGKRGAELNSRMMGLYAGIEDPVIRDAGWEYIKFYDCQKAVEIKTRIMVEGGLGRFVNPKYLEMFGYSELIRLAPKGWSRIFEIAIETGKPEPYGRHSNIAYDLMTEPIEEAEQLAMAGRLPGFDLPEGTSIRDRYREYIEKGVADKRLDALHGLLKRANADANEQMIGIVPPGERFWRRVTAGVVLAALVVVFGWLFRKIIKAFTPPAAAGGAKRGWQFRRYAWAYVLLLPALLSILVWRYIPLVRGSIMAFFDYKIMRGLAGSVPVWLDNFGDVLWNGKWWHAVLDSVRYSLLVIGLTFLPPVILAILLQEVPRGKILFRTIYYLPAITTGLVLMLLWKSFYEPSERGALNGMLIQIPAVAFLVMGAVLFAITLAFARRLLQHGITAVAVVFGIIGFVLLRTGFALARPILFPSARTVSLAGIDALPAPYSLTLVLAVGLGLLGLAALWAGRAAEEHWKAWLVQTAGCFLLGFAAVFGFEYLMVAGKAVSGALDAGQNVRAWLARTLPETDSWVALPAADLVSRGLIALAGGLLAAAVVAGWISRERGERRPRPAARRATVVLAVASAAAFAVYCVLIGGTLFSGLILLAGRMIATLPEPYRWLSDPDTAMFCCVLPMVWAGMGPGCLIYLAALKGIAEEYYEAAEIDGATFIDKILFIVFPILKPLLIINFVGVFIGSWQSTANILAMTGGAARTEVAGLHIFYKAFIYLKFGPATAMAWVLGFMLIGFTVHQLRILSRLEFRAAGAKK